jgi:3-methyladenine DNA glycosylase AlkD
MKDFINNLKAEFEANANTIVAKGQKAYMKNHFDFYGIKTPVRRELQRPFLVKEYLPPKKELPSLIKTLWNMPEREFQLFGQELVQKYVKLLEEKDIELLEYMIKHKSWWDTVDFIAVKLVGAYFKLYPQHRNKITKKWMASENIWLQRTVILFQLEYKKTTDVDFLSQNIQKLLGSKEFFINKAIGWILRQYSKTNPQWVKNFVAKTDLHSLSRKEALRLMK